ncbi:hypothetical protein MNBD_ALPHA03-1720 [hydrothermal vent metagenome]|uniref:Right handed beta helix domain-containing protein n=1 Tax=hydrothermal vent metagenome TaxID=652676 RepID=A0A3B1B445_9ZZZZ
MRKIFPQIIGFFILMAISLLAIPSSGFAKIWLVGPDFQLKSPSSAIRLAKDGDTIKIMAGLYENDYAVISQNNITLIGMNGFAHLKSSGPVPGGKAIWTINGENVKIQNIEFSGVKVPDKNGAGIRLQKGSLTVDNCYFHGNDMGLITSNKLSIRLLIKKSEFSRNILLVPDLVYLAHNIYVGKIAEFIMKNTISRGAQYGHNVKSRAQNNIIKNNRIFDEGSVSASYLIDLPNGGKAHIENNYLYKNKGAQNNAFISYGAEGMKHNENSLTIQFNTAINEGGVAFLLRNHSDITAKIAGNNMTNVTIREIPGIKKDGFMNKMKKTLQNYLK